MVFAIYEQGHRIVTPKEQLLNRPQNPATQAIAAERELVDHKGSHSYKRLMQKHFGLQAIKEKHQEAKSSAKQQKANPKAMAAYAQTQKTSQPKAFPAKLVMSSPVIYLNSQANLNQAWMLMQQEEVNYLVLQNEVGELVGVLNKLDLLKQAAGVGRLAKDENPATTPAIKLASEPLLVANENTDIRELAKVMLAQSLRAVPLVNQQEELTGLITRSDLIIALANSDFQVLN